MQPKKQKIKTCLRVWFVIFVVNIVTFQLVQWLVLANFLGFTTYICSANSTNSTTNGNSTEKGNFFCYFNIVILSGTFASCVCVFVFDLCWIPIISFKRKKFETVQAKSAELGLQVTELQRQMNERPNRNTIHIGRPNNDESVYTELPNEREQLLTQSQLPNYQSTCVHTI